MFNSHHNELAPDERVDILGSLPFFLAHLVCIAVIWTGISWAAVIVAILLYLVRMFFVTGFFHRYFSHKTYIMNRFWQFLAAFATSLCAQKGPIFWASHHRHHHKHSDEPDDVHSAKLRGWWWAHCGWVVCKKYHKAMPGIAKDLERFAEIRFFDTRLGNLFGPVVLGAACFFLGVFAPASWHTNGMQMLIVGFFWSTVALWHGTFFINSWAHTWGTKRYDTGDESKNNFLLALITLGEGWHNNHHQHPYQSAQRDCWWEVDITHYMLVIASWLHIIKFRKINIPQVTLADRIWATGTLTSAFVSVIICSLLIF